MASVAAGRRRFPSPVDPLVSTRQLNLLMASLGTSSDRPVNEGLAAVQKERVRELVDGLKLALFLKDINRLIIDVGSHHPQEMARVVSEQLRQQGQEDQLVGVVFGGDLLPSLETLNGQGVLPAGLLADGFPVAAQVSIDALPLRRAIAQRAQIIVTSSSQPAAGYVAATQFFGREEPWCEVAAGVVQTAGEVLDDPSQAYRLDEARDPSVLVATWPVLEVDAKGQVWMSHSGSDREPVPYASLKALEPENLKSETPKEERYLPAYVLYDDGWQVTGQYSVEAPEEAENSQALAAWLEKHAPGAVQELRTWLPADNDDSGERIQFRLTQLTEPQAQQLHRSISETYGMNATKAQPAYRRRCFEIPAEALEIAVVTRPAEEWLD